MKKIYITALLSVSVHYFAIAQELKTLTYSTSTIENSKVELSGNWITNIEDNVVKIFNGTLKNGSDKNLKNLNLDFYLVPSSETLPENSFNGYFMSGVGFKSINKNSNLTNIYIKNEVKNALPDGEYSSYIVLSDNKGNVLDIEKLKTTIQSANSEVVVKAIPKEEPKKIAEDVLSPKVVMNFSEDKSISFDKEWKIDIDFKNFMVKMVGGDISNFSNEDLENVVVDVFLTKENMTQINSNFNGLLIASAPLDMKLEKYKNYPDANITTNLRQIPQNGTYYMLLTLSVKDTDGNLLVKTKRAFPNAISF